MKQHTEQILLWGCATLMALIFALFGKACSAEEVIIEQITIKAPQAMHQAFEETLVDLKIDDKYEIDIKL